VEGVTFITTQMMSYVAVILWLVGKSVFNKELIKKKKTFGDQGASVHGERESFTSTSFHNSYLDLQYM